MLKSDYQIFLWQSNIYLLKVALTLTFPADSSIPINFSNLNSNCSNSLDLRNLQEQVKKAFCYQKLFGPFTIVIEKNQQVRTILVTKYHGFTKYVLIDKFICISLLKSRLHQSPLFGYAETGRNNNSSRELIIKVLSEESST